MSDTDEIDKVIGHIDAGNTRNVMAWMGDIRGWLKELKERRAKDEEASR